ncbi:alpha/beta hydrolase [Streptomyces sp. NPDC047123]|uniref:alpha/beta fold hydrolase n=1 Tax=Streptomyces sp. NPDC047123 TaxID=3155622 RepID=UPI0033D486F2
MSRPPTFVPPACATARTLRTDRGDFAVLDAAPAEGAPRRGTVLLLPGFTGSKEDFIALLEPLARAGYRAVSVDGRGQYETPGPDDESAYAQAELARDVLAQAAALGAGADGRAAGDGARPHLLGHSLGGQIARAAVLRAPGAFATLTLMSSGPAAITPLQRTRAQMLAEAVAALPMDEVWQAMRAMEPPPPQEAETGRDPDDGEALRARWLLHSPAQLIATGRQLSTEPDRVAELTALPLPKHVISGERDDTWPVPLLDEMAERLGARRTVIRGAEHSPNTDRPAETAAALVDFWHAHGPR